MERLNGEFRDREKVVRGLKKKDSELSQKDNEIANLKEQLTKKTKK